MSTLLRLDCGASPTSTSRRLTSAFADAWSAAGGDVVARDLHADPLPHLEHSALHWPAALRPGPLAGLADVPGEELRDEVAAELAATDALLVAVPMYNWSMPSTLKAWLDRVHVPGLLADVDPLPMAGKPAVLVSTRGLSYEEGDEMAGCDFAVPPVRLVLGTMLGMAVETVTVSWTLAHDVPDLAPRAGAYDEQLATALATLAERGSTLAIA